MKAFSRLTIYGTFLMALLGSALGQQVKIDFDHHAGFSQYKTYSWQEIKDPNSLWDARMKSAVNAQLAAKGWTQVDSVRRRCDCSHQDDTDPEDAPDIL